MAYNRWLAHHGVKGQKWGEKNGPPYPLDSSKSDGHKLLTGDGSSQGKKKYKTSEKTAHKRAERKARTDRELEDARQMTGKKNPSKAELAALRRANKDIESHKVTDQETKELIRMDHLDRLDETYSVWDSKEKTEALKNARANDKWELDFLEYVQNEEWADSLSPTFNKKRMLKEYSEYLDDREAYAQKGIAEDVRTLFKKDFANGDPAKYISDIAVITSDSQIRREQRRFSEFAKNVPLSKRFKELQQEADRISKEVHDAEYDLIENGGDPKAYQKALSKSEKVYNKLNDEACEMLGVDPSKLNRFQKGYIRESIENAQYFKNNPQQTSTKPKKKSISERINSFKDRIFGSSKKAQEKGQQKVSVNYEPVTSEKAKTKRGETYEINDWNGNAQDTIKAFKKDPESHINVARKAAIQEARQIIGWYAKDNPEAKRLLNMSDQQLSKRIGLDFVSAHSHGTIEFSFGDAGTGDFLGHEVDVEYDLDRRKVMNVSVNG